METNDRRLILLIKQLTTRIIKILSRVNVKKGRLIELFSKRSRNSSKIVQSIRGILIVHEYEKFRCCHDLNVL